jgi:ectoine hydroxylase-related dioxygenase (phytanoyl-CoA dioxygenase family)
MPTDTDIYHFDLKGYLILKNVVSADHIAAMNAIIDSMKPLVAGQWYGNIHAYAESHTIQLQQIYEAGEPFERLIDYPGWFDLLKTFIGGEGTFDHLLGPLFIDENFAMVRESGGATPMHSGGHERALRTQYRYNQDRFQCGQINILLPLMDMGPGDGATTVIPGSHKANFPHPKFAEHRKNNLGRVYMDDIEDAVEVHTQAGDALLFVDSIAHGSARRINPGERRVVIYRYGPSWGNFRRGYQPSAELLERLTPQRRQIVQPQVPVPRH